MATNTRETRRRKIVDRGSDRLALITGRIPNIPSSSSPSESHPDHDTHTSPPLISHDQDLQSHPLDQATVPLPPNGEDESPSSMLLKHDPITATDQTSANDGGDSIEPPLRKCATSNDDLRTPDSEVSGKLQAYLVSSMDQNSSISNSGIDQSLEPRTLEHKLVFPKHISLAQISAAIASSESTRLFCSVTIAFLVVLSYLGFPLLGSNIISFRPIYLVLLTDLTVVLSRLLLHNQRRSERTIRGENKIPSTDSYGWAEQVGKALEVGFVMQKVMDALFMDCSVYAVIVICGCGLSFV